MREEGYDIIVIVVPKGGLLRSLQNKAIFQISPIDTIFRRGILLGTVKRLRYDAGCYRQSHNFTRSRLIASLTTYQKGGIHCFFAFCRLCWRVDR